MENKSQSNGPLMISFTLSFWQRVLNPPGRLLFAVMGISISMFGLLLVLRSSTQIQNYVLAAMVMAAIICVFRHPIYSLYISIVSSNDVNKIEINTELLTLKASDLAMSVSLRDQTVIHGFLGTSNISNLSGQCITVPSCALNFEQIINLIKNAARGASHDNIAPADGDLVVAFSLTRKQRFWGWPRMPIYAVSLLLFFLGIPLLIISAIYRSAPSGERGVIEMFASWGLIFAIIILILRGPFFTLIGILTGKPYVNIITIGRDSVLFGMDKATVRQPRSSITLIKRGRTGCVLEFKSGNAILIPYSAISFHELETAMFS